MSAVMLPARKLHQFLRRDLFVITFLAFVMLVLFFSITFGQTQPAASAPAKKSAPAKPLDASPRPGQQTFSSARDAAAALYNAARTNDEDALLRILGPDAKEIVVWTDDAADRKADADRFAQKYDQMHRLVHEPDGETTLYIGAENWPLPVPLVEKGSAWFFDVDDGGKEILYRRIGENELETIAVCRALVDAEKEYFAMSAPPVGAHEYAAKFDSDQGKHDGLYWVDDNAAVRSPIGPNLAEADYGRADHTPFDGYYFRVLTSQGARAPGGAKSYMVDGAMKGGFAFVAFPAEYRVSGVKTFVIGQDGIVREKDLGPMTGTIAQAMSAYNPDATWQRVSADGLE